MSEDSVKMGKSDLSLWDSRAQNRVINGLCSTGLRVLASIPVQPSSPLLNNSYHSMYLLEDRGILSTLDADTMGVLYNLSASFVETFADIDKVVNAGVMAAAIQKTSFEELLLTTTKEEILDWDPATGIPEMKVLESGERIKLIEAYEELRTLCVEKSETSIEHIQGASVLFASSRLVSGPVFYKFYLRCRKICHNLQYLYPERIGRGYADFVLTTFRQTGDAECESGVEDSFSFMMGAGWPERRRLYTQRQAQARRTMKVSAPAPAIQFSEPPPASAPAKASASTLVSTLKSPAPAPAPAKAAAPAQALEVTVASSVHVDKPVPVSTKAAAPAPASEGTVESPRNSTLCRPSVSSNGVEPLELTTFDMEGEQLNVTDNDFGSNSRSNSGKNETQNIKKDTVRIIATREEQFRQIVLASSKAAATATPSGTRSSSQRIEARKEKKEKELKRKKELEMTENEATITPKKKRTATNKSAIAQQKTPPSNKKGNKIASKSKTHTPTKAKEAKEVEKRIRKAFPEDQATTLMKLLSYVSNKHS